MQFSAVIQTMRPRQWTKNLLVFLTPLFAFSFDSEVWFFSAVAFAVFCIASSSIYLINDVIDAESDRRHPTKKVRPIASGRLKKKDAINVAMVLILLAFLITGLVGWQLFAIIFLYLAIQVGYCLRFKAIPLLDIFFISSGFLLRAVAGGVVTETYPSSWFLLTVGLLALFLAVEKRKAELIKVEENKEKITRKVLERYSMPLLLRLESLVSTSAFLTYSLWSSGPGLGGAKSSLMLLTIPLVLIGIFRYQLLSDPKESFRRLQYSLNSSTEKPEEIFLNDIGIRMIVVCWLAMTIIIALITL